MIQIADDLSSFQKNFIFVNFTKIKHWDQNFSFSILFYWHMLLALAGAPSHPNYKKYILLDPLFKKWVAK